MYDESLKPESLGTGTLTFPASCSRKSVARFSGVSQFKTPVTCIAIG